MSILTVLIPELRTTSGIALSSSLMYGWLKANGFPIRTSKKNLCISNTHLFRLLDYPKRELNKWIRDKIFALVKNDDTDRLGLLLEQAEFVDSAEKGGGTALMLAARMERIECLKLLLDHKADLEAKNSVGNTALIQAAMYERLECIQLLLDRGADLDERALRENARNGNTDCLKLLLDRSVNMDCTHALIPAAIRGNAECLKILLENGADPEVKVSSGETILAVAARAATPGSIRLLLEYGAKVDPETRAKYPQYAYLWWNPSL